MRGKSRQKNEPRRSRERPDTEEGSRWELVLFGLFFVTVVFMVGTYARADISAGHASAHTPHFRSAMNTLSTTPAAGDGATTTGFENRLQTRLSRIKKSKRPRTFDFGGAVILEGSRTLDPDSETNYVGNIQLQPNIVYTTWNVSGSLQVIYNREFVYERDDGTNGDIDDIRYGLRKTWRRDRDFKASFVDEAFIGFGGFLPASRMSKKRGFTGSIGPRFGVVKKLNRFTLAGSLLYTRSEYSEDIDASGRTNNADAYTSVLSVAVAMTDRLSLTGAVDYTYLVDHQNLDTGAERAVVGLGYKWFEHLSTVVGVATSRATVDSTGQTELFKFYGKESALAYLDLVVSI